MNQEDMVTITMPREQWEAVVKAMDVALHYSEKNDNSRETNQQQDSTDH